METQWRHILNRILREEQDIIGKEIIAPVLLGGKIRIKVGALIWECRLENEYSGWGIFKILPNKLARLVREANAWEKEEYVRQFKKYKLTLLYQDPFGTWWAYNLKEGKCVPVRLVENLQPFDEIITCYDSANFWFLSLDRSGDSRKFESLRGALEDKTPLGDLRIQGLKRRDYDIYRMAFLIKYSRELINQSAKEKMIRQSLTLAGAELIEWFETPTGYSVRWRKGNDVITSMVDKKLSVISAGFCLSGGDRLQDLTSLASLIDGKGNYDVHRYVEYYH